MMNMFMKTPSREHTRSFKRGGGEKERSNISLVLRKRPNVAIKPR